MLRDARYWRDYWLDRAGSVVLSPTIGDKLSDYYQAAGWTLNGLGASAVYGVERLGVWPLQALGWASEKVGQRTLEQAAALPPHVVHLGLKSAAYLGDYVAAASRYAAALRAAARAERYVPALLKDPLLTLADPLIPGRAAVVDPQLDANLLIRLSKGDPVAVAYAEANRSAGLSYNFSTRFEFLNGGTRAELRLLEQTYDIQLIRDVPLSDIQSTATNLRGAFTDGRTLGYWDSQVAASAYLKGERLATGDLQFFKRAMDLGLNVDFVGTGRAAQRAAQYMPRAP